jgi:hypothetical protein
MFITAAAILGASVKGGALAAALLALLPIFIFGVVTLPGTDIEPRQILKGAGKLYAADATSGGADGTPFVFLGASKGGFEFHFNRKVHIIEVDQYLNGVAGFPMGEEFTCAMELAQLNLKNWNQIIKTGDAAITLTGGDIADTASSLTMGEAKSSKYFQLVWKGEAPPGATSGQRLLQAWKCILMSHGTVKLEKTKDSSVKCQWRALTDVTAIAAGKAAVCQFLDS